MKNTYRQEPAILYYRRSNLTGLKSLFYFILMALLLCSMLFLPDKLHAYEHQTRLSATEVSTAGENQPACGYFNPRV